MPNNSMLVSNMQSYECKGSNRPMARFKPALPEKSGVDNSKQGHMKTFADDWFRTADLWYQK